MGDLIGWSAKLASSVSGRVTQCMVRSPVTLYLSPDLSILRDRNDMSGHPCTSKKSADLRCPSRFSLLVLMLEGSTLSSTELFAGSSLFQSTVEENLVNCPRRVVATMCFTEKPTVLWLGSASRITGAAARRAARTNVILSYLLEGSGDLPELYHRGGVSARGPMSLERPLGVRAAGVEDLGERIEVLRFVQTRNLLPPFEAAAGDRQQIPPQIEGSGAGGAPPPPPDPGPGAPR